jgi:hypothetical protein
MGRCPGRRGERAERPDARGGERWQALPADVFQFSPNGWGMTADFRESGGIGRRWRFAGGIDVDPGGGIFLSFPALSASRFRIHFGGSRAREGKASAREGLIG